jgi:ribosomal protein S8
MIIPFLIALMVTAIFNIIMSEFIYTNPRFATLSDLRISESYHSRGKTDEGYLNENLLKKKYDGKISQSTIRAIQNKVSWLIFLSTQKEFINPTTNKSNTFKVNFITLTLSDEQNHTDNYIKKQMLEPFLKWLQYKSKDVTYVWRAEKQMSPNSFSNIHFHILTDRFFDKIELSHEWNNIQKRHGYTLKYCQKYLSNLPPSTKIHAVQKLDNTESYVTKYTSKSDFEKGKFKKLIENKGINNCNIHFKHLLHQYSLKSKSNVLNELNRKSFIDEIEKRLQVKGKIWGTNHYLSQLNNLKIMLNSQLYDSLNDLFSSGHIKIIQNEFTQVYINNPIQKLCRYDSEFNKWFEKVKSKLRSKDDYIISTYLEPYSDLTLERPSILPKTLNIDLNNFDGPYQFIEQTKLPF